MAPIRPWELSYAARAAQEMAKKTKKYIYIYLYIYKLYLKFVVLTLSFKKKNEY